VARAEHHEFRIFTAFGSAIHSRMTPTDGEAELNRPLAVTTVHAVRPTVTTLGAHVGAKLQRAVAWIRLGEVEHHGA
jgi:hypothetical protein